MVLNHQVSTGLNGEMASLTNTLIKHSESGILSKMVKVKLNGMTMMMVITITTATTSIMITTSFATKMNLWKNTGKKKMREAGFQMMTTKKKASKTLHGMSAMMRKQTTPILATEMLTWNKLILLASKTSGWFLKSCLISGF
jgi:hypothetical protein